MIKLRPGMEFTHDRHLDHGWRPGPGQKYTDGPKARMRISRVTKLTVYYTYLDGKGTTAMERGAFLRRFGDQLREN